MTDEPKPKRDERPRNAVHRLDRLTAKPSYVVTYDMVDELDAYYEAHPLRHLERRCAHLRTAEPVENAPADAVADYALEVRGLYLSALESVFATWAAHVECPTFPPAWLLLYRTPHVHESSTRLIEEAEAYVVGTRDPWLKRVAALFPFLNQRADFEAEVDALARCTLACARDLLRDDGSEWNGMKHGLRVRGGRFAIAFKPDDTPDESFSHLTAAAGTHVPWLKPLQVPGYEKRVYLFAVRSVGIDPRQDLNRLELLCRATRNLLAQAHLRHRREGTCAYHVLACADLDELLHGSRCELTGAEFTPIVPIDQLKPVLDALEKGSAQ